jgi:hypothetical protein
MMTGQVLRILATVILLTFGNHSHEKLRREVVLFGVDNRECNDWKRIEQPKFEADGWVVATSKDPGKGPWPQFIIERHGKQYSYKGYLLFSRIDEAAR